MAQAQARTRADSASRAAWTGAGAARLPPHLRCVAVVALLALTALAGWMAGTPLLATLVPGRPALSPMTAVLLLLGAAAVAALPSRRRTALALGSVGAAAGLAIALARMNGWTFGPSVWWSSPLTGVAFALSGLATVLLSLRQPVAGQLAAFTVLLYAALLGIGHLFPHADLYRHLPGTGVAIPTVLAFIVLSVGQLVSVDGHGATRALSRRTPVGLLAMKLLLGSVAATLLLAIPAVHALRRDLFDAETAVLLVTWGAIALLGSTLWGLAMAVDRAQATAAAAEQGREDVRRMVAAALTHDLRSPLQTAQHAAQALARLSAEPRAAAAAERLQRSHRRIDRLLRSLLDALSMDAGRTPRLQACDVRLDELVREVVAEHADTLGRRVALQGTAQGHWDRDALLRVVENLLLNAVKHGSPDAPIQCEVEEDAGAARLVVTNQGPAIAADDWEAIFQPFTRGGGRGSATPGWGVGLAYARSVAILHAGRLRVLASGACGTRFELCLPTTRPEAGLS
jgi:signal transduction histidine kinase